MFLLMISPIWRLYAQSRRPEKMDLSTAISRVYRMITVTANSIGLTQSERKDTCDDSLCKLSLTPAQPYSHLSCLVVARQPLAAKRWTAPLWALPLAPLQQQSLMATYLKAPWLAACLEALPHNSSNQDGVIGSLNRRTSFISPLTWPFRSPAEGFFYGRAKRVGPNEGAAYV